MSDKSTPPNIYIAAMTEEEFNYIQNVRDILANMSSPLSDVPNDAFDGYDDNDTAEPDDSDTDTNITGPATISANIRKKRMTVTDIVIEMDLTLTQRTALFDATNFELRARGLLGEHLKDWTRYIAALPSIIANLSSNLTFLTSVPVTAQRLDELLRARVHACRTNEVHYRYVRERPAGAGVAHVPEEK